LATLTKGEERVTVQIKGDGPIGSITADANGHGQVRGYVANPTGGGSLPPGRPRLATVVGQRGIINVVRDLGLKELYQGQIPLVTGEIDEDVEAYLRVSEQVPSALGCEVVLDDHGAVVAAGGLLLQALPGGEADSLRETQHLLRTGRLYELLAAGERSGRPWRRRSTRPVGSSSSARRARFASSVAARPSASPMPSRCSAPTTSTR